MHQPTTTSEDMNLVEIWLRKDPARWIAGAMAGFFAGLLAILAGMVISTALGYEIWFPIKYAALPILGGSATEYGIHWGPLLVGFVTAQTVCVFLGFVYAHFTGLNSIPLLLGAGFTWGCFSWIFINNLYTSAFPDISAAQISKAPGFFVCMVFGLSLTSVAFFDRLVRGSSK